MKIVKIAALAVLVLGIFGVGLWLNVGGGGPTIKPMKPFNNIEEVRKGIDDYVANLYSWDKSEYEELKSRIDASIRLISSLTEEAQNNRIDECYKDLEGKTGARIAELLDDELERKSCQYKTASNLGSGLKYFMNLNGDKSDAMISIDKKYDAYSSVYWFVQNPMRKMKDPALKEYMEEQFENGDVVLKGCEEVVKKDWKDQCNLAESHELNHITELANGLSDSSIEQKLVDARSNYYKSLWEQSQEYYNALNALMDRAIGVGGDRSNNIDDVERECKQIFGELNKINESVGFASNPMSDDVSAIQEVYSDKGFSAHNYRLKLFSINVGGVEDLIAKDTKFTDAAYVMYSDFNKKLNNELNPKLQNIINAINNR